VSRIQLSVVVATWNRLPELRIMLDSLLPQVSGKPVEILIADDRSTDGTWEWLQTRFAGDPGIHVFRMEQNGGPGPARNLCLASAGGDYFLPIDSDFIVAEGAIDVVLGAIREHGEYSLLFFPCLHYPDMRRIDGVRRPGEIGYGEFVLEHVGELIPVARLDWLKTRGLGYPQLRAGGEGLLWAEMLADRPGFFVDQPIILYRTDVTGRICTLEYQLAHPADLAAIADATIELLARNPSPMLRSTHARKCLAAGAYHLLAGNAGTGRRRLVSAIALGCLPALGALLASFTGRGVFGSLFRVYRTRLAKSYL
jgi:GalNAc5-diNAcBac-PP-undecaprenol beta-1,3-glucosyltransferase